MDEIGMPHIPVLRPEEASEKSKAVYEEFVEAV